MKGWHKNSNTTDAKQFFQVREDLLSWQRELPEKRLRNAATLISQGAEGKVYYSTFLGRDVVTKERVVKNYRVASLDAKLNRTRLLHEARCMVKGRQLGIDVPEVYMVDAGAYKIVMEKLDGLTLKALLHRDMSLAEKDRQHAAATAPAHSRGSSAAPSSSSSSSAADINLNSNCHTSANVYSDYHLHLAASVGRAVAALHAADIVHGDLTTSNIMIRNCSTQSVALIDFGLGSMQAVPEDKAVDLYVLERALLATHPGSEPLVARVMEAYAAMYAPGAQAAEDLAGAAGLAKRPRRDSAPDAGAAPDADADAGAGGSGGEGNKSKSKNKNKSKDKSKSKSKLTVDSDEARHEKCLAVLRRLGAVRMRGRKRDMFG